MIVLTLGAFCFLISSSFGRSVSNSSEQFGVSAFPKLKEAQAENSVYTDNNFSYRYVFDDGKIASENATFNHVQDDNFDEVGTIFGEAQFRFLVDSKLYDFKFVTNENGIRGELGKLKNRNQETNV